MVIDNDDIFLLFSYKNLHYGFAFYPYSERERGTGRSREEY
jgi:hypothetical protein